MFKKKQPSVPQSRERSRPLSVQRPNASVFSYHANRTSLPGRERMSVPEQQQVEQKQAQKRLPRGIHRIRPQHVLSVLIILIIFLLAVGLQSNPKVVVVSPAADKFMLQNTAVYQKAAKDIIGSSPLNSNKLTIDTAHISAKLQEQFPELRTVSVSLPFIGRQPTVYVQPAQVKMILATASGQYAVDASGRALRKLAFGVSLPKASAIPVVQDKSGLDIREGDLILPSSSVAFISEVAGQLAAKGVVVESWSLPLGGSELHVKIAGVPYYVKFNLQGSAREQVGAFLATKKHLESTGVTPGQYYDVRVSGRAYYL